MPNGDNREAWVRAIIKSIPAGNTLLDVGAGECIYRADAGHLTYITQDIAEYEGAGDGKGLHTKSWNTSGIDIRCDLLDIPEDTLYDAVLCSEVLEHVPDPVAALRKIARLVKPEGRLIVTAPFASITHFAPYHFATGFNRYFYEHHLPRLGFVIERIEPNGTYFDFVGQEVKRSRRMVSRYGGGIAGPISRFMMKNVNRILRRWAAAAPSSSELATFGWQVLAIKTAVND